MSGLHFVPVDIWKVLLNVFVILLITQNCIPEFLMTNAHYFLKINPLISIETVYFIAGMFGPDKVKFFRSTIVRNENEAHEVGVLE